MKIRTGFVSNSSSSSYIIIYKPLDLKKIMEEDWDEADNYKMIGKELNEGQDYISLTEEFKDIFKFFDLDLSEYQFIQEINNQEEDEDNHYNIPTPVGAENMYLRIDQNTTRDVEGLFQNYFEEGDKEKYSIEGKYQDFIS